MRTIIEKIAAHVDARGSVFEPLDAQGLAQQRNVHIVTTAAGETRGNHRHIRGTEVATISGPALIRLREDGQLHELTIPDGETWRLTIPAGVSHAYRNTGNGIMLSVGFNTEQHHPQHSDVERDALF